MRHILETAGGRRFAVIVNDRRRGVDGEILQTCGFEGCDETNIIELANGCLCCTVADDFVPTIEALLGRPIRRIISLSRLPAWRCRSR